MSMAELVVGAVGIVRTDVVAEIGEAGGVYAPIHFGMWSTLQFALLNFYACCLSMLIPWCRRLNAIYKVNNCLKYPRRAAQLCW